MEIFSQFLFRLALGLAVAMGLTPCRRVTAGFFRNHLYVLLGLNVAAVVVALLNRGRFDLWLPAAGAAVSYVGAVCWLYERAAPGKLTLWLIAALDLGGAWATAERHVMPGIALVDGASWQAPRLVELLHWSDPLTGGLVLGATLAAMLLGHWYLNAPGMQLAPLRRLVAVMTLALLLRLLVCGAGLVLLYQAAGPPATSQMLFLSLRWLAGLIGPLVLAWMTWQTLKIPNTQAATGILYVAVIGTFLGELTSQLLSARLPFGL